MKCRMARSSKNCENAEFSNHLYLESNFATNFSINLNGDASCSKDGCPRKLSNFLKFILPKNHGSSTDISRVNKNKSYNSTAHSLKAIKENSNADFEDNNFLNTKINNDKLNINLQCFHISNGIEKVDEKSPFNKSNIDCFPMIGTIHTQIDYVHCLVPDLQQITKCNYYWGVMNRFEAEKLLDGKPEGTFLLRDSAQEDFLFSVSFRRYGRSLHARIEQLDHKFSFDSHDSNVFSSNCVSGLIEHYKDPSCCMFFEPMLTIPLSRTQTFSLQFLCRAVICNNISYDGVNVLPIPKSLMNYLQYYHYKQRVRVRQF